jgi:hypothetical protein
MGAGIIINIFIVLFNLVIVKNIYIFINVEMINSFTIFYYFFKNKLKSKSKNLIKNFF